MQARKSLYEKAKEEIKQRINSSKSPNPRVVWWDDGGYLRNVIEAASEFIESEFIESDSSILSLREKTLEHPDEIQVWYIPESKDGRDWFRDVKETGGEIEMSIEDLTASLYEDVQPWDIYEPSSDENERDRDKMAKVLLEELKSSQRGLPIFSELRSQLITNGHGNPLEYILKSGWDQINQDSETVEQVRQHLQENRVHSITSDDDPEEIENKLKKWAVGQWLVEEGLGRSKLPEDYQINEVNRFQRNHLASVIKNNKGSNLDEVYLESYWTEVIDELDDPWKLVGCPVDSSLEHRLWNEWINLFNDEEHGTCQEYAEKRAKGFSEAYGEGSKWSKLWSQAHYLASLAEDFNTWEEKTDSDDVIEIYADEEDGTWRIDRSVRHLIVSGKPETDLPNDHPATETLPEERRELVRNEYLDYLEGLAEKTITSFDIGSVFDDKKHAYQFWRDNKENLATGESVCIFYIDALRLDLARELAENLRDQDFEVRESVRAGTLPSSTEFGMGALTPGDAYLYKITLDNGDLEPKRSGRTVNTNRRERLLENEGWGITKEEHDGWENVQVAYFDKQIDDIGEVGLTAIEEKVATQIENLTALIKNKMDQGDWDKIYIVTDHGFVLLPENMPMETITPPDEVEEVDRRYVAGHNLDDEGDKILVDETTPGLEYMNAEIKLLVQPLHRYRKQGISDERYYHGGALPQEFVLDFLEVQER